MASELFLVVDADRLPTASDPTLRPINLMGSSFDEPGLRAWMATEYGITASSTRSAFAMLRAFGLAVLMVFPADRVGEEVAALLRERRDAILARRSK